VRDPGRTGVVVPKAEAPARGRAHRPVPQPPARPRRPCRQGLAPRGGGGGRVCDGSLGRGLAERGGRDARGTHALRGGSGLPQPPPRRLGRRPRSRCIGYRGWGGPGPWPPLRRRRRPLLRAAGGWLLQVVVVRRQYVQQSRQGAALVRHVGRQLSARRLPAQTLGFRVRF
jgi:hypothetical protein